MINPTKKEPRTCDGSSCSSMTSLSSTTMLIHQEQFRKHERRRRRRNMQKQQQQQQQQQQQPLQPSVLRGTIINQRPLLLSKRATKTSVVVSFVVITFLLLFHDTTAFIAKPYAVTATYPILVSNSTSVNPLFTVSSQTLLDKIQLTNKEIQSRLKKKKKNKRENFIVDDNFDDDEDKNYMSSSSRWLPWMARGTRITREAEVLKMREAEALGGLPRTDRYSSKDWLHNTISLPNSRILRDIRSPVLAMTTWASFLSFVYRELLHRGYINAAEYMCLPQTPHSLMVSSLSLLLVFKTNSAYQRFAEGRKIWEKISNSSRDLYRMMILYENEIGRSKRRRIQRLLAAFPYLLRHRIRPNVVMYRLDDGERVREPEQSILLYPDEPVDDYDPELTVASTQNEKELSSYRRKPRPLYWVDKRTLPWRLLPPKALEPCARAQNRPLWVCDRMAQELRQVPDGPHFTARERLALLSKVDKLSACIGACERIHQTAVPLNYARHSLRALTLWLFTLPFCLVKSLQLLTGPVIFLVSWLLFGVYEIGYSIEDPFQGTLRLSVLCETIRRDVLGDELIRNSAFEFESKNEEKSSTSLDSKKNNNLNQDNNADSDDDDSQTGDLGDYESATLFVKQDDDEKADV